MSNKIQTSITTDPFGEDNMVNCVKSGIKMAPTGINILVFTDFLSGV